MKQFLIRSGIFLALMLTLFVAAEMWVRQLPNDYSYKKQQLLQSASDIEVLILGSSHSLFGLNPEFFSQPTFNFALTSQSLAYDRFIFERFAKKLPALKSLVIPVGFFSLGYELEDGIEAWRQQRYVHYLDYWPELDLRQKLDLKNYSVIYHNDTDSLFEQVRRYRKRGTSPVTVNDRGWSTLFATQTAEGLDQSGRTAAARHNAVPERKSPRQDLQRIIALAAEQNVEVLLFIPPAWESYRNAVDQDRLSASRQYLSGISEQYANVRFLDLFSDPRFGEEDFYDGDHVNHSGARKLSMIISSFAARGNR